MNTISINGRAIKNLSLINPADWALNWTNENVDTISLAQAYRDVGWFRSACDTRANAVMSTPWEIMRGENPVWDGSGEVPLELEAFGNISSVFYQTALSLLFSGGAWFLKVSETGRRVDRLQYMAPDTIEPILTKKGLLGWERRVEGVPQGEPLPPEDVLYVGVSNPFQELPPKKSDRMPEAGAALKHASVLYEIDNFTHNQLKRGLVKPAIVYVPPGTGEAERNRLKAWFSDKFGGAKKSGNFGIVEADAIKLEILGDGLAELGHQELTETHRQGVCSALRVPYYMLLTDSAANRSVAEQAARDFMERVVTPDLRRIERAFNEQLFDMLGYRLVFHPERLEMFQAAELDKADQVATLWTSGLVTRNEAREPIAGLAPIDGEVGEAFYEAPAPVLVDAGRSRMRSVVTQLRKSLAA